LVNDEIHKCEANVEEVMDVCDRFEELTILLDGFFSIHMRPYKTFLEKKEDTLNDLDKYVKAIHYKWRQIGLSMQGTKIHAIHHLVSQYEENEGYEFFDDHFIEDGHRRGNNEYRLTGSLRDYQKKYESNEKRRKISEDPNVQKQMEKFSPNKKTDRKKINYTQPDWVKERQNVLTKAYDDYINKKGNQMINYWNKDCEELDDD